jgi:hypothetical protein
MPESATTLIRGFDLYPTEVWWERPPFTRAVWEEAVDHVLRLPVSDQTRWALGDLMNYAEPYVTEVGEPLDIKALMALVMERDTFTPSSYDLYDLWLTARFVDPSRRRAALSFAHHVAVAGLGNPEAIDPAEQVRLLDKAEEQQLTVEDLRAQAVTAFKTYHARRQQERERRRREG